MAPNKQVMRLNALVVCDGCATNVNPYVIDKKFTEPESGNFSEVKSVRLECPTCGYDFTMLLDELPDKLSG